MSENIKEDQVTLNDLIEAGDDFEIENIAIPIDTRNLFDDEGFPKHAFDSKEFSKGVKEASFYAGFISALKNACVPDESIMAILDAHIAKELLPVQIKAQKDIAQIEVQKGETMAI